MIYRSSFVSAASFMALTATRNEGVMSLSHGFTNASKWCLRSLLVAAVLVSLVSSSPATAAILLSDNFTVTSNSQDVNQEAPGDRQTGPLAGPTAYVLGPEHHQVGNTGTDVGQPGGVSDGNHVLLAFNGWFQSSFEIGAALAASKPLRISFDMYRRSNPFRGGDTDWGAFTLRSPGGESWPVAAAGEFGWLFRNNGGLQMFQTLADDTTYDVAGQFPSSRWEMTFSDSAGTGSAFSGNGSLLVMKNGAGPAISVTLNQLNSTGLVFGFRNFEGAFVGIDNLLVQQIPEPSTMAMLAGGVALVALRRLMA
jgi:hypothetical protein